MKRLFFAYGWFLGGSVLYVILDYKLSWFALQMLGLGLVLLIWSIVVWFKRKKQ